MIRLTPWITLFIFCNILLQNHVPLLFLIPYVHAATPSVRWKYYKKDLSVYSDACKQQESASACRDSIMLLGRNKWTLKSSDGVYKDIPATVPGDILTDLQRAGIIHDPFYDNNFLDERHVWMGNKTVLSNGTSCYDDHGSSKNRNSPSYMMKEEYKIPHLERRTRTWIYQTSFTLENITNTANFSAGEFSTISRRMPKVKHGSQYLLVVEGIKMGSSIAVNGVMIGNVTNQFLRRIFPLPTSLLQFEGVANILTVTFDPDIDTRGRFMACSGGWDWAPYSMAAEASCSSRRVFSFGIVKPIYIIKVRRIAILHVLPKVHYIGDPLIYPLDGIFRLNIDVHLLVHLENINFDNCGKVVIKTSFAKDQIKTLNDCHIKNSERFDDYHLCVITWSIDIPLQDLKLWWPNGMGEQNLYTVEVSFRDSCQDYASEWIRRHIGFRSIALVTHNENHIIPEEGTGSHGMYFKINGIIMWTRGANVVPMSQLEGRLTHKGHEVMVRSAAAANMNMLRIWGGGMVMPRSFYDACDRLGVLLYHDLMFVEEQYHSAEETMDVEDEVRFIVRSLLSHPSIALWNGCNECERFADVSADIYSRFILPKVVEEDGTRPIWGSSPSSGFSTGVFGKDGLPNGHTLLYNTNVDRRQIEIHGPYNHGASKTFFTVDGHWNESAQYIIQTPFKLYHHAIGVNYPNHFVSEFGASVFSTFESMHSVMGKSSWGVHGDANQESNCTQVYENANECFGSNVLSQRNYPCDNHIQAFFGESDLNRTGRDVFQSQLYRCMIAQMLWMKGTIEMLRSQNSYGTLIWQLNDNWPTGSWGLLEYGSNGNEYGQVLGGRWKPLMYLLKRSLFQNIFASCGVGKDGSLGRCFIRNSGHEKFIGTVVANLWFFSGDYHSNFSFPFTLDPRDTIEYFNIEVDRDYQNSTFVILSLIDNQNRERMGQNVVIWNTPSHLHGLSKDTGLTILSVVILDSGNYEILLASEKVSLYVYLTSLMQGIFEDNAFSMLAGSTKRVLFILSREVSPLDGQNNTDYFIKTLRMDHLARYLS